VKVSDVIERIRFNTATTHDLSGKSSNKLFTNKHLVLQLKFALDKYAQTTKALEEIFTIPLIEGIRTVDEPPDILRTQAYRYFLVWIGGRKYSQDMMNLNRTQTEYPYENYSDIPRWIMSWIDELYIYPTNRNTFVRRNLTKALSNKDTTVEVETTDSFPPVNGRFTIGDEKIRYQRTTETQFINCTRGIEGTKAVAHNIGDEINENNFYMFYYKKHFEIPVDENDLIDQDVQDREMDVVDEHMEVITDYTAYKLLLKVDPARAAAYKINFGEWLREAKYDIQKGRSMVNNGTMIRDPYDWENVHAYNVY